MDSRRHYTAPVAGIPIADQEEMARAQGLKDGSAVYQETKRSFPRERNKVFDSFRAKGKDEHIWVSDLVVLVPRRRFLRPVLKALKKANAYIFEGRTGRRSKKPGEYAEMLHDAIDYWAKGRLPHHRAVEYGREGGETFARNRRKSDRRMPKGEAVRYWRDAKYGNWREALEAINSHRGYKEHWSRESAYRSLGKRGLPSGPRGPWKK